MTRTAVRLSAIVLILCSVIFRQEAHAAGFRKTGTSGFVFLKIPVTARQAGLGESSGALTDGAGILALFGNPAALGFQTTGGAGATCSKWLAATNYQSAGWYNRSRWWGSIGIGLNYLDYGKIPHTSQPPGMTHFIQHGYYSAQDIAMGLTYSRRLTDRFAFGIRLNRVSETIYHYSATNILADMGVVFITGLRNLQIGGFVNHFGVDTRFIGDTFKMPTELHLSLADDLLHTANHRLTAACELVHPSDNLEHLNSGLEYCWRQLFSLRIGHKWVEDEDRLSCGAGLTVQRLQIDLAVLPFGRFEPVLFLSIHQLFGK